MRPPRGFEAEKWPLRHRLTFGSGLALSSDNFNTFLMPVIRYASGTSGGITLPNTIQVNPHNSAFEQDAGPLCANMSIIDRLTLSLQFNMTHHCGPAHLASGTAGPNFDDGVYEGDDLPALKFLWRPIFNIYPEKMDAADDQTGTTVAAILGFTKDATNEDVVPITTNDLPIAQFIDKIMPKSTVNSAEVFGDYNYTTDFQPEDHVFDEDLLQEALRRYTNKGALRSCLGRTRHVTLTRKNPVAKFYINKFLPNAVRRIQPYAFFGIQVHMPLPTDDTQIAIAKAVTAGVPHLGIRMLANFHEWNSEHDQERGTPA